MALLSLSEIWIYPVKSLGGIALETSQVEAQGLQYDRRWMVTDENGQFLTQRQLPRMATLRTTIGEALTLTNSEGHRVQVPLRVEGAPLSVRVWRDEVQAVDCGPEAAQFLSDSLGRPCRLVGMNEVSQRKVDPTYAHHGEVTSFSDGFPFLILGQSSLDDLNDRLLERGEEAVEVERFRPNFVFTGGDAYAEDAWGVFRIGNVEFEAVKPCSRCVITTLDPQTGEKQSNEPLQTLATYRRMAGGVCFAQNALARSLGTVHRGDSLHVATQRTN